MGELEPPCGVVEVVEFHDMVKVWGREGFCGVVGVGDDGISLGVSHGRGVEYIASFVLLTTYSFSPLHFNLYLQIVFSVKTELFTSAEQNNMSKIRILLYLLIVCFKRVISEDQVTILTQYCSEGVSNDPRNTYQNNLNLLLSNLTSEAATKKFYNSSIGSGQNKVEGIFLCNGAYTTQVCTNCITVAAGQIQQKCPNDVEAMIWYGQCMLRYSNRSILSIEDDSIYQIFEYGPTDYKQYDQQLSSTLIDLSNTVMVDDSELAFANGVVYVDKYITLIAYVECTPDLKRSDCKKCLQTGLNRLKMNGVQLRTIVQPSCRIAYFYVDFDPDVGKGFSSSSIALITVAAIAGTSLILNLYMYLRKVKARGKPTGLDEMEIMENLHLQYNTIKTAADNFAPANKIGQGGFGVVYMGMLPDGQAIAVKRLASQSGQGIREFKSEACLVAKLQHKNLVKLFGFCLEGEEKLLVYEFVPNKSLDRYLFDAKRGACLNWETRKKVLMGIARGLVYLHEDSRFKIIHRDLKPSNILLDADMNPKIADFGMAKLFGSDQTQGNTSRVAGTFGYMAPEYATTGQFSVKSDVFSFGVILLEVVSGRRNSVSIIQDDDENLLNYAWRLWNEGSITEFVDPNIKELCSTTEVTRYIHIGLLSIQEDASRRPTMASILSMMSNESIALPSPKASSAFPYRRNLSKRLDNSNAVFTAEIFTDVNITRLNAIASSVLLTALN
ncbi:cysteine-rich receptor-like protein kinase 19 [Silene latifolia]|uniref:cysteine-rich receptor-like protein kinase 19 n=1 Tax=Silene latifolia TaxID=37657 RepID=UPI003D76E830